MYIHISIYPRMIGSYYVRNRNFRQLDDCFFCLWQFFFENYRTCPNFLTTFSAIKSYVVILTAVGWAIFHELTWSPCSLPINSNLCNRMRCHYIHRSQGHGLTLIRVIIPPASCFLILCFY